jgi:hypothetical protein
VLFRSNRKVLLLDEVDFLRNQDKERYGDVVNVLNVGFERGSGIERWDAKAGRLSEFDVYGPKALAGIEGLADTLADRAFQIRMKRSPCRMPRLNVRILESTAARLRADLQTWEKAHADVIRKTYDRLGDGVDALAQFDDRFQDIAEPLVVLAALADRKCPEGLAVLPELVRGLGLVADRREPSSKEQAIVAFLELIKERLGGDEERFIPSSDVVEACTQREELNHIETTRGLASFLKTLEMRATSNGAKRGYWFTRDWHSEWERQYPASLRGAIHQPESEVSMCQTANGDAVS